MKRPHHKRKGGFGVYSELDDLIVAQLDSLYRFVSRRIRDEYKAEDIVQNIVLTAYRAYVRLPDKSMAEPWLFGIARNLVAQAHQPWREVPTDEIAIIDAAGVSYETPESDYLRQSDIETVRRAVASLAKSYRDVCVLHYLEGKDYQAISEELGIPLSSVKWRLHQSRNQLREELEKMDYMPHRYHKAIPLKLNMGGWVGKWDPRKGAYDNADKALESLLAQNICQECYLTPKTAPELAANLGVAADYVEEFLQKLVETQSVKQIGNRYQTMFPIWDAEALADVFEGNLRCAQAEADEILEMIFSLESEIAAIGFCGADKGIDRLILFLLGFVCHNTEYNRFETEKLPFVGDDKAWYVLATTAEKWSNESGVGINSSGSMFGLREYYFAQPQTKDNRFERTEDQKAFYAIYQNEAVADAYALSRVLESGKVVKTDNGYRITVPVISTEKGEETKLKEVLTGVFARTNSLQKAIYDRSCNTVRRYIPKHIAEQTAFFGSYCAHGMLEEVLWEALQSRGLAVTPEMATWFIVK